MVGGVPPHAGGQVGVEVVPDQHDRAAELLVGGDRAGRGSPARRSSCARRVGRRGAGPVDQPGAFAGLVAGQGGDRDPAPGAAPDPDDGVCPRRPQVRARGGVIENPASSSKTIQAPSAAAVLPPAATPPSPSRPPRPRHARAHGGPGPAGPAVPPQQLRTPGQCQLLWNRRPISVLTAAASIAGPASHAPTGPLASSCSSTANCSSLSFGSDAGPLRPQGPRTALRQALRHRCTDRTLTRRSLRDHRSSLTRGEPLGRLQPDPLAERPPLSGQAPTLGYLIPPAYRRDHEPSALRHHALKVSS